MHLSHHGYFPDKIATNIWSHKERETKFCLCVDDFGVQSFSKDDANHLIEALLEKYIITTDFTGKSFRGLDLVWNYVHGWVDISMNNFIQKTLKSSYLNHLRKSNMHLINGPYRCMDITDNLPHRWMNRIYSQKRKQHMSNEW